MSLASAEDDPSPLDLVGRYVADQCRVIIDAEDPLRQSAEPVHDTRVAIRRLRSTLRVFASVFESSRAAQLNSDLTWYAAALGTVRDREVLRLRLRQAVADLPSGLVLGPVRDHIDQHLASELAYYHEDLVRAMDTDRYRSLLDALHEWAGGPPYAVVVDDPEPLLKPAKKASRKAKRRLAEAQTAHDTAAALHRARKAAKRARYSAELVEPLDAEKASARIRHFKRLQTILGAYQDSVIAADVLRQLGAGAGTMPGHNGFTYGLLYAQ